LAARGRKFKGRRRMEPRRHSPRESERSTMLNLGRLTAFRFDMREIMSHYEVDEAAASTMVASVIAKGSRISIAAARDYVRDQEKAGACPREAVDEICNLLDRFSKLR